MLEKADATNVTVAVIAADPREQFGFCFGADRHWDFSVLVLVVRYG
jgi:hypothetical protein